MNDDLVSDTLHAKSNKAEDKNDVMLMTRKWLWVMMHAYRGLSSPSVCEFERWKPRGSRASAQYVILAFCSSWLGPLLYGSFPDWRSGTRLSFIRGCSLVLLISPSQHISSSRTETTMSVFHGRATDLLTGIQIITNWWTKDRMAKT